MSEGNGYATKEQFLARAKRRFKDVYLPVSGLKVRIRSLMDGEKEAYEASFFNKDGRGMSKDRLKSGRRRLVALCLVDGNGDPMLGESDVEELKGLDGADMATLQDECSTFCGFKEGDIEGLVKNSDAVHVSG